MSDKMKQVLENSKTLTAHEKATLAHCLIASLDEANEADVEEAWARTAEARFAQLQSGAVQAVSWEKIKLGLKRKA